GGTTDPTHGTYTYTNGTYASVTAIPSTHYLLSYWLLDGNPAGSANPISVLMTDDHTLQPIFVLRNYTLTITATAGGTTNPAPGVYIYSGGANVQVTASAGAGYKFDHWVLDGSPAGSASPITVLMDSNHSLEAVFAETHTLMITASAGGTTNPAPGTYSYDAPTYVVVTAVPYANYRFDHWVYDGENIGSENPVTVYVGSSHTLYAVFTLINRTLKIETTAGGTTNPAPGTYTHPNGTSVQVTAIANANYVFDHWELDAVNVGSANPYIVLMDKDHTLKAVFVYSPPPPQLSVSINPLSAAIKVGESVYFTSSVSGGTPSYHYQWYLNGNPVPGATSDSWTFSPTATGVYYVYLNVTDSQGNSAQSATARVTVTEVTPPVGGYTVQLTKPTLAVQLTSYALLLAFFSLALSLIRRKRK
ncbi:MAG: PKD domain-containing protein, partial [Candidatus Bathyarchaeia archaeon]